jgi:hypothetical protein
VNERPNNELVAGVELGMPAWLPVQFVLKLSLTRKWQSRATRFAEDVMARSGLDADEIGRRLERSEPLADATFQAAEKVVRTGDAEIHSGLAALIAAGLSDDALVDDAAYYTSVLAQLEPVHLRLLKAFGDAEAVIAATVGTLSARTVGGGVGISAAVAQGAAERLHGLSLLTDRLQGDMVNWAGKDGDSFFRITAAGHELLSFCRSGGLPNHQG